MVRRLRRSTLHRARTPASTPAYRHTTRTRRQRRPRRGGDRHLLGTLDRERSLRHRTGACSLALLRHQLLRTGEAAPTRGRSRESEPPAYPSPPGPRTPTRQSPRSRGRCRLPESTDLHRYSRRSGHRSMPRGSPRIPGRPIPGSRLRPSRSHHRASLSSHRASRKRSLGATCSPERPRCSQQPASPRSRRRAHPNWRRALRPRAGGCRH